jgi:hypothetical protein
MQINVRYQIPWWIHVCQSDLVIPTTYFWSILLLISQILRYLKHFSLIPWSLIEWGLTVHVSCKIMILNVSFIFLSTGIFKHSQSISKSYLTEMTPRSEQSGVLGKFNGASSIGFILGPMVGGRLAETSGGFYKVTLLCTATFILNAGE